LWIIFLSAILSITETFSSKAFFAALLSPPSIANLIFLDLTAYYVGVAMPSKNQYCCNN